MIFVTRRRRDPGSTLFPYTTLFRSTPAAPTGSAQILVVEDETALRGLLVEAFTTLGHRVHEAGTGRADRKSTRLNSSHRCISYAVFCLKKKTKRTSGSNLTHDTQS